MCGRYALDVTGLEIADAFAEGLGAIPDRSAGPMAGDAVDWTPRWNIAPTQEAPVIRLDDSASPVLDRLRWGLVPPWADDPVIGSRMINARGESVHEKPSYREPFRHRRCLVPIRAFYEWKRSHGGRKVPYAVRSADDGLLLLAGLWTRSDRVPEGVLDTFTIVTTAPNARFASIHDRMPVVLDGKDRRLWLDHRDEAAGGPSSARLRELLRASGVDRLRWHPVSTRVNRPTIDEPSLLAEVEVVDAEPPGLFGMSPDQAGEA